MTTHSTELDAQRELDKAITKIFITIEDYGTAQEARDEIYALIAQREQAAELRGRIDELKGLHNEGGEYELITYASGEQQYLTERLSTLQATKPEKEG